MNLRLCSFPLLFCSLAPAQNTSGSIVGTITDDSGRVVPSALIRAVNEATGIGRETRSNVEGAYVLASLPIGRYRLEIEAPGMARETVTGIPLEIDRTVRLNIELQPAAVFEAITVTAPPPLIETQSGARGAVIENRRIV